MTRYEIWIMAHRIMVFDSLEKAQEYMTNHGFQYVDFMACDHPFEYRHYYLPVDWDQKYSTSQEAFEELYGFGYEPNITPVEV